MQSREDAITPMRLASSPSMLPTVSELKLKLKPERILK
jgi:hypothetical protein